MHTVSIAGLILIHWVPEFSLAARLCTGLTAEGWVGTRLISREANRTHPRIASPRIWRLPHALEFFFFRLTIFSWNSQWTPTYLLKWSTFLDWLIRSSLIYKWGHTDEYLRPGAYHSSLYKQREMRKKGIEKIRFYLFIPATVRFQDHRKKLLLRRELWQRNKVLVGDKGLQPDKSFKRFFLFSFCQTTIKSAYAY